jgi:hypothetical protein
MHLMAALFVNLFFGGFFAAVRAVALYLEGLSGGFLKLNKTEIC